MSLVAVIETELAFLDGGERSYPEKVKSVRTMLATVNSALADSALTDTTRPALTRHTARLAIEKLRASVFARGVQELGANVAPRSYRVPVNMALWQIAKILFGDARRWNELRTANAIQAPNTVRAGTTIYVIES